MSITKIDVALHFGELGYIGLPFWPERNTVINIMKDVYPKLGDAKKDAAIRTACDKKGISAEEWERIKIRAERPFYTLDEMRTGEIVIPQRVFQSFRNNTSQEAPKAIPRITSKGLTFIGVKLGDGHFRTGKFEKDAKLFERFTGDLRGGGESGIRTHG
jgi:hypothetical protein